MTGVGSAAAAVPTIIEAAQKPEMTALVIIIACAPPEDRRVQPQATMSDPPPQVSSRATPCPGEYRQQGRPDPLPSEITLSTPARWTLGVASKVVGDPIDKLGPVDGLADVVVAAEAEALIAVFGHGVG